MRERGPSDKPFEAQDLRATAYSATVRHAFTLIELIVVLVVLSILAAVAVPRFANGLLVERLDAAARRVESDVERLRLSARRAGTSEQVVFDATADAYTLSPVAALRSDRDATEVVLNAAPYEVKIRAVNFGGDTRLVFDGWGVADSSGWLELFTGTQGVRLTLDQDTGRFTKAYLTITSSLAPAELDPVAAEPVTLSTPLVLP